MIQINIAIIAHDNKKELIVNFCIAYKNILQKHIILATGKTGAILAEGAGLQVQKVAAGELGGEKQVAARIALNEIDLLICIRDPFTASEYDNDIHSILRLCDVHNIPFATNAATAEMLVRSLDRGDLEWRELLRG